MTVLLVTAVEKEAEAIGRIDGALVIVSGIGRTNAAAATTETIIRRGPFESVMSIGLAGSLPGSELAIGDAIAASACIYMEEGIITPSGFSDMSGIGFAIGDFEGNVVPVDRNLLEAIGEVCHIGPIATVATCSGTDAAAAMVARRSGAVAEAMEGAAVVHAARRLHTPAIELRVISNTTGDRSLQRWDIGLALSRLGKTARQAVSRIASSGTD